MLELKNICKTYRPKKGVPVQALKNVSIKFTEKGMVFILGKSGCGKSTLLNCIGGLDKFDSGELIIKGKSSKDFSGSDFDSYRNTFIGFIFQEYNILSEFNVEKNIALALELQGKKATHEKVQELLEQVDLADQGKRKTNELSGGQKQRIAIARALIKDPEIIIADEPTGALDSATGKQVFDTLKKLSQDKLVIIVSHDREFAENYADRIIEMKDGVIISDETKRHIDGQKLNDGVSVIGDDVIHIKAGHTVTQKEVEFITKYIQKRDDSEAFISLNPNTNKKFREIAKIDDNNAAEKFDKTTSEDLTTKTYDRKDLKLIKSRLKFKDSFKMGASGLKAKPVRLIFTIFLSFIAFAMFGIIDTASAFNAVDNTAKSIQDSNVKYLSMYKKSQVNSSNNYYYFNNSLLGDADIADMSESTGVSLKPVYTMGDAVGRGGNSLSIENFKQSTRNGYYIDSFAGLAELTKTDLEAMGCTLVGIGSRYPTSAYEILLTKYQVESFMQRGYKDDTIAVADEKYIQPEDIQANPSVLIGKKLSINGGKTTFTICGIIDTKFDGEKYKEAMKEDANFVYSMLGSLELEPIQQTSIHNIGVVGAGTIESIRSSGSETVEVSGALKLNGSLMYYIDVNRNGYTSSESKGQSYSKLVKKENLGTYLNNFSFITNGNTELAGNTVVMSAYRFGNMAEQIFNPDYNSQETITKEELLACGFSTSVASKIVDSYGGEYTYTPCAVTSENISSPENIRLSVIISTLSRGQGELILNSTTTGLGTNYTLVPELQRDINTLIEKTQEKAKLKYNQKNQYDAGNVLDSTIVGFFMYYSSTGDNKFEDYMIVGADLYIATQKMEADQGVYGFAIGVMPTDSNDIKQIAKKHFNYLQIVNDDASYNKEIKTPIYLMSNEVVGTMNEVKGMADSITKYLMYVALGFCLFASLMLMNFIATSISYKKREIGILRALGSKKSDVFGIFFNESLIIAFINFVLASIGCMVTTGLLNAMLRKEYELKITIFNFGIRQLALILVISVAVAFISSLIPVSKIAKKQPIDAINNR